eukprot:6050718-Amphidinium_carterae.1
MRLTDDGLGLSVVLEQDCPAVLRREITGMCRRVGLNPLLDHWQVVEVAHVAGNQASVRSTCRKLRQCGEPNTCCTGAQSHTAQLVHGG